MKIPTLTFVLSPGFLTLSSEGPIKENPPLNKMNSYSIGRMEEGIVFNISSAKGKRNKTILLGLSLPGESMILPSLISELVSINLSLVPFSPGS